MSHRFASFPEMIQRFDVFMTCIHFLHVLVVSRLVLHDKVRRLFAPRADWQQLSCPGAPRPCMTERSLGTSDVTILPSLLSGLFVYVQGMPSWYPVKQPISGQRSL